MLEGNLLVSTAYHLQSDGLSEHTNQTVEIALRYLVTANPGTAWHESLPTLQVALMNSLVSTTRLTPNQVLYGHATQDVVSILQQKHTNISANEQCNLFRREAADVIEFANTKAKLRYDKRHKQMEFEIGDRAYLRLHHGYTLPEAKNRKLSNQRVGPFKITRRVGKLAYKLKLPPTMRIYPVVLIAQLKPAEETNPYNRRRLDHPKPVEMEQDSQSSTRHKGDTKTASYEVEKIMGKWLRRYGKGEPRTEYQVKWLG